MSIASKVECNWCKGNGRFVIETRGGDEVEINPCYCLQDQVPQNTRNADDVPESHFGDIRETQCHQRLTRETQPVHLTLMSRSIAMDPSFLPPEMRNTLRIEELETRMNAMEGKLTLFAMEPVLRLWESDPHQFSPRPCATCNTITALTGRPFGCARKR